jgi:hypothetical protein
MMVLDGYPPSVTPVELLCDATSSLIGSATTAALIAKIANTLAKF